MDKNMRIAMLVILVLIMVLICVGCTFVPDYNQNLYYMIVGSLILGCGVFGIVKMFMVERQLEIQAIDKLKEYNIR